MERAHKYVIENIYQDVQRTCKEHREQAESIENILCIDSHNDLPWNIRKFMHNKLHSFNFTAHLQTLRPWSRSSWSHTDLPRLRQGMVGAQFWASYVPCEAQRLNAVQLTIEQIDLIKRLIDQYPDDLRLATSADELEKAFKEGRIASLIGVEGGHAIQSSLGVLRALRDLGVRYLTLTHTCSTPWAECARAHETDLEDPDSPRGLTHFGKTVVREMNRLGLMVDLSHVSQATMKAALEVSRAPVIFSHSSVYAICKNPRNVPDDILRKLRIVGIQVKTLKLCFILRLILFLIYVNDLRDCIDLFLSMFAGYSKIRRRIKKEEDGMRHQDDLDTLKEWSNKWLLDFNSNNWHKPKKTPIDPATNAEDTSHNTHSTQPNLLQ
ncbi:dipeptidase 1-like [Procambarus clarkii]|uniref:dipeptidase 1-like n=1 Tax=Procambarus clarkii TaxID=6728 RepID=UPI0037423B0B